MKAIAQLPRLGPYITGAGLLAAFLGLGWDVWMHSTDHASTSAEDIFTLANPSHVLAGGGLVIAALGVSLTLLRVAESSTTPGRLPARALAGALVIVTSAVLAFGFATSTPHGHDVAAGDAHDEAALRELTAVQLKEMGLSQEEIVLVELSRQSHDHDGPELGLSAEDVLKLAEQVAIAKRTAERYASIDTALREGYIQITQDLPLIGAHFISPRRSEDDKFDLEAPEMIIYAFQDGDWRLYGLSYLTRSVGYEGEVPFDGFVGDYDVWHWHKDWCFTLRGAKALSPEDCSSAGGLFVPRTGYMTHFWLVDNPKGVFSHDHPGLRGSDEYITPGLRRAQ